MARSTPSAPGRPSGGPIWWWSASASKYQQWNAAFDAGYAVALGKPIITLHDDSLTHALKEVDAAAQAVAETPEQVVEILKYVTTKP